MVAMSFIEVKLGYERISFSATKIFILTFQVSHTQFLKVLMIFYISNV